MKKTFAVAVLLFASVAAKSAVVGKLDLSPDVSPIMIREIHDGQWLAGVTKENLFHLEVNGIQRAHAGVFQAWNAEQGNASFGMVVGVDLPSGFGHFVAAAGDALGFSQTFKPLQYIDAALSIDAIGGYRPVHTADVHSWIYGVGARLNIAFGVKELQKGL